MKANTARELSELLQAAPPVSDSKERGEFGAVRSWAYSSIFEKSFSAVTGPFEFGRGPDPPDFCVIGQNGKVAIEATTFTSGQFEVFCKERAGAGSFTSTLRKNKPDKLFRERLRGGSLPDDSQAIPHFEALSDLDGDYADMTAQVLEAKVRDLVGYRSEYLKCILLVHDKLSNFSATDWERRVPVLQRLLGRLAQKGKFEEVILVNGNSYSGNTAVKV